MLEDAEAAALPYWAVIALGGIGPAAQEAVPALNSLLDSDDEELVIALDRIGEPPITRFRALDRLSLGE